MSAPRTKLDEIVEEEMGRHILDYQAANRIAERSYEHGVSQEWANYDESEPRPRPARSEDHSTDPIRYCVPARSPGNGRGCVLPSGHAYVCREERRVKERRVKERRVDLFGRPGRTQGIHAHLWRDGLACRFCGAPDRRSGKDRRGMGKSRYRAYPLCSCPVGDAVKAVLPEPPPGFTIKRVVSRNETPDTGTWLWYATAPRPWSARGFLEAGDVDGRPVYELTGPPPLPRFEHTGEYRAPKKGERYMSSGGVAVATEDFDRLVYVWILRKVEPDV